MGLVDCAYCKGIGKSILVKLDNGESLPCYFCDCKGKVAQ